MQTAVAHLPCVPSAKISANAANTSLKVSVTLTQQNAGSSTMPLSPTGASPIGFELQGNGEVKEKKGEQMWRSCAFRR